MKEISVLLLLILSASGYCQEQTLLPHWKVGDSYDYEVTKTKKKIKNGKAVETDSTTFYTNFKVLKKEADDYTIQWRYENDILEKLDVPLTMKTDFADYKITEVIYKTDLEGTIKEVTNWEAIAQKMKTLENKLTTMLGSGSARNVVLQKNVNVLMQIYSSKEGVEQLVMKELQAFHFSYGVTYSLNDLLSFEQELPSLVGGAPIKGEATLKMTQLNEDKKEMTLLYTMRADPNDAQRMVREVLNKLKFDDLKMKNAIANSDIQINDLNFFVYDFELGIPNIVNTQRTILIKILGDNTKQIDCIKIKKTEHR